jgi:asparagine synthase (glutamine-hydrolysing)
MCGLAGVIRVHAPGDVPPPLVSIPDAWVDILDAAIAHRGPDGAGRFRDRITRQDGSILDVALVHRRLSIIDQSGGNQPMVLSGSPHTDRSCALTPGTPHPDPIGLRPEGVTHHPPPDEHTRTPGECAALVFNGCLYNHRVLRERLAAQGHRFETDHSDTEVMLRSLHESGLRAFDDFEGMYSVGFWKRSTSSMLLARDVFGEKPLYWFHQPGIAAFASTASALAALIATHIAPLHVNANAMKNWLARGFQLGDLGLFDIAEVLPGQVLDLGQGDLTPREVSRLRVWPQEPGMVSDQRAIASYDEVLLRVEAHLERAVGLRLEADTPLACFLSGGVDSSLIALMARRHTERLETLCVRMPMLTYDESPFARRVAASIGTHQRDVDVACEPASDLILLIEQLGLPFADSSLLPSLWVSRAALGGAALSGDGGDELFAGYERQWAARYLSKGWSHLLRVCGSVVAPALGRSDPRSRSDKLARLIEAACAGSYRSLSAITQESDLAQLMPRSPLAARDRQRVWDLKAAQSVDLEEYLPGDLLRKTDTASMASPIELRCPLLDRSLAREVLPLSARLLGGRTGRERKGLLRDIARKHLPAELVDRPKQGFAVPIGDWFRTDFGSMRQCLFDHLTAPEPFSGLDDGLIDRACIARWLREHDDAGPEGTARGRDHSQRLFALLSLSIWCHAMSRLGAQRKPHDQC